MLEAIPLIKKNFAVLIDQHGGKNQLLDHQDRTYDVIRYATSADSLVPVGLRDNKNAWCLSFLMIHELAIRYF